MTIEVSWTEKLAALLVKQTARVPQIPAKRCTGMAPTTSSIFKRSNRGTAKTTMTPPTAPIRVAETREGVSGSAVMDTKPAKAPFKIMVRSGFLYRSCVKISAATAPAAADVLVLEKIRLISATLPDVSM